jgi:hypothetical protein
VLELEQVERVELSAFVEGAQQRVERSKPLPVAVPFASRELNKGERELQERDSSPARVGPDDSE